MILNPAQATAIFGAIYALNNLPATHVQLSMSDIEIDHIDASVSVIKRDRVNGLCIVAQEDYGNYLAFAEAYGLTIE